MNPDLLFSFFYNSSENPIIVININKYTLKFKKVQIKHTQRTMKIICWKKVMPTNKLLNKYWYELFLPEDSRHIYIHNLMYKSRESFHWDNILVLCTEGNLKLIF